MFGIIVLAVPLLVEWLINLFRFEPKKAMKLILIILAISAGVGGYYWFSIRPANIKKDCLKVMGNDPNFASDYQAGRYKACLIQHGL